MNEISFVTGGCGFVGRNLVKRLLKEGHSVWILDNLSVGKNPTEWLPNDYQYVKQVFGKTYFRNKEEQEVVFIQDDALNFFSGQLRLGNAHSLIELPPFNYTFHLASVIGGRAIIEGDPLAVAIDLAIDAVFFRWLVATSHAAGNVLYTSSSAAYPIHLQTSDHAIALREELISFDEKLGMPDLTYGWSKLSGEYLARIAAAHYGIKIGCVRPFSGYGGDQDQTYPIPAIARRATERQDPLIVWGSGQQARDFVHIDDCIEAMWQTINTIHDGTAVNIGTGILTNFRQVAQLFAELAGYAPDIKTLTNKPEGVAARYADTARMTSVLAWQPSISLRAGFAQVLAEQKALIKTASLAAVV